MPANGENVAVEKGDLVVIVTRQRTRAIRAWNLDELPEGKILYQIPNDVVRVVLGAIWGKFPNQNAVIDFVRDGGGSTEDYDRTVRQLRTFLDGFFDDAPAPAPALSKLVELVEDVIRRKNFGAYRPGIMSAVFQNSDEWQREEE
jgi:hypothetical protein